MVEKGEGAEKCATTLSALSALLLVRAGPRRKSLRGTCREKRQAFRVKAEHCKLAKLYNLHYCWPAQQRAR